MHQLPSVDVFIGLFFLFGIAYSFIFQRDKIVTTLCSVYVGIVIAGSFSGSVYDFFNGNKVVANQIWIKANASSSTIAIALLLLSIFLVSSVIKVKKSSDDTSALEIFAYSFLSTALILSTILGFLPEQIRTHYIDISLAARYLYSWHTFFVIAPPITLIFLNWQKGKK